MSEEQPIPEQTVWAGGPSQMTIAGRQFACFAVLVAVIVGVAMFKLDPWIYLACIVPAVLMLANFLRVRCTRFRLTTERLIMTRGVLSKSTEELELFRVKDSRLIQPLGLRLLGLGNIELITTDATTPSVIIPAICGCEQVREQLRQNVNLIRERRGVRVIDVE